MYRFDNLIGKPGGRNGALFAVLDAFPLTRCRCLILPANGLSFMFFAWMIRDGSNGLR
jgi:hypothetical protein